MTMIATDATAAPALEAQLRQLLSVLERLSQARRDLIPAAATFWHGDARARYDRSIDELDSEIGAILTLVGYAQQNTALALAEAVRRG